MFEHNSKTRSARASDAKKGPNSMKAEDDEDEETKTDEGDD